MKPPRNSIDERVLVLAPTGRDQALAQRVLSAAGLTVEPCADITALGLHIEGGAGAALLTEEALTPPAFRLLCEVLARQPPWSDLPLLLLLRAGLITQVRLPTLRMFESLHNVTYLERPVRIATLISALRTSLGSRRRQYEVRDHLIERNRVEEELRRANESLAEMDQRKDQFLALLGHELRNPLAAISNAMQLLCRPGAHETDRDARTQALMERQIVHLTRLVDDLLEVSRVTAGKIILQRERLDLAEVVKRCLAAIDEGMRGQGHELVFSRPPQPVWVEGDAVRLEQVITNLLTNAGKYTPPGGRIELSVEREGEQGVVRVKDNGTGITAQMLPQVFDLFSQSERTLDRSQGGLGIGLTLVRSLVEMHGGSVVARSEGAGQGSEFVVRLSLAPAAPQETAPAASEQTPSQASGESRRILLIEDNADVRESLQELLEDLGHQVRSAEDGPRGIASLLADLPQVALVDIGLPGIDGYEVARQVRAAVGRDVFLVAMTGYGQPDDRRRSLEAGFDAHLTKPPNVDALMKVISQGNSGAR